MVALVRPLPAVLLGQLDAVSLEMVDCADVGAISADDFHMLFDLADICHNFLPYGLV
jgi:hypothetical protein